MNRNSINFIAKEKYLFSFHITKAMQNVEWERFLPRKCNCVWVDSKCEHIERTMCPINHQAASNHWIIAKESIGIFQNPNSTVREPLSVMWNAFVCICAYKLNKSFSVCERKLITNIYATEQEVNWFSLTLRSHSCASCSPQLSTSSAHIRAPGPLVL